MKMDLVETESKRKSSSQGDLEGGGATLFGHYWMMPGSDSDEMFRYIHLVHTCLG